MPLTIYKASAGSGKTYTLTRDFIEISLQGYTDGAWRRILGVTFTNKAASEMKDRIILKLNEIIQGKDTDMCLLLSESIKGSSKEVQRRAELILQEIIHDYGAFSVMTIDSFLQKIFRSFLYELDVNYNFELRLDATQLIEDTVRAFIFDIEKNSEVFKELVNYLDYSLINKENYNIQKDVVNLGKELVKEDLYEHLGKLFAFLDEPGKFEGLLEGIRQEISTYKTAFTEKVKACILLIEQQGLTDNDFDGKSRGVWGYLHKVVENGFELSLSAGTLNSFEKKQWHHKDSKKQEIVKDLLEGPLNDLVVFFNARNSRILSLAQAYGNLPVLHLLMHLEEKRKSLLAGEGYFFLSDVPRVLKNVIMQGGAGMVYEKTGNRYDCLFIDEFQDTSQLQWDNFFPLVENSLAQYFRCNIVGDVKQAIYRWRNGDWTILAQGLKEQFPDNIEEKTLNTNRRSLPAIVDFNNLFFEKAAALLDAEKPSEGLSEVVHLYNDSFQEKWKTGDGPGYVCVTRREVEKTDEFTTEVIAELPALINELWQKGCKDIAVLLRDNKEIANILEVLMSSSPEYPIVTEKSFRLDTNPAVKFIFSLLKALSSPDEKIYEATAAWWFYASVLKQKDTQATFEFHQEAGLHEFFLSKGYSDTATILKDDHPYSLVCKIIEVFDISSQNDWQPFISAFLDAVYTFVSRQAGTAADFLKWYDKNGDSLQIQVENTREAVKIMTIHKSKGLQFSTVIMPFVTWEFSTHANMLWVTSEEDFLKEFPLVPVKHKQELLETSFRGDYLKEEFRIAVDNLNLLYVAFTRAENQMYINYFVKPEKSKTTKKKDDINSTMKLMDQVMQLTGLEAKIEGERIVYKLGEPYPYTPFQTDKEPGWRMYKGCYGKVPELVISPHRHQEIFSEAGTSIEHGVLLHSILEEVRSKEDFFKVLNDFQIKGTIDGVTAAEILGIFDKMLQNSTFSSWFDNTYQVYNERSLLMPGGFTFRPDRIMMRNNEAVVVDYKTGTSDPAKYFSQVKRYMKMLEDTGLSPVTGWIVQLDTADLLEVKR
ncbi:MAG: hypothetical protein CVU05_13500 [Bacteroidetes bacterium HGW-Bacteroidetes-21]|nr:MAG: hypothetical protein CVU05_13500 [Bacteroidetes bacterium HGW-Bacteroidetes-21]